MNIKSTDIRTVRKAIVKHFEENRGKWVRPMDIAIALGIGPRNHEEVVAQQKVKIVLDEMIARKEIKVIPGAIPGDVHFVME